MTKLSRSEFSCLPPRLRVSAVKNPVVKKENIMKLPLNRRSFCALLALGALSGCNSSPNSTATDTPSTSGSTGGTIKMVSMDYDPDSSKLQQKVVDDFNAQSKDGKVELEIINWNDGHQKLQTLIQGNQAPDLAIVGVRWMAEYEKAGLVG